MPEPGAASLGRSLLPRRPGCSLRRRLGTLPQFGEGDKLHKSCWPAPEGDALCRAHLTPRGAPGTSPQPRAQGPCRRPATRSARRRSVAPPPCPPPSLRSPLALVPTPRGNLKHGDPNGGFRLIDREKTRRPSRPFRRGLRGRPLTPSPRPEAGSQAPRAGPADAAARRRPERAGPWARGSAHRLVAAGVPARGRGPDRARRDLGSGDLGGRAARKPRSAAQPRAPCPRPPGRPPHLAKGRPPSGPPAPAGRKVTSAGQRARARGGVWTGSARVLGAVRRRRGRGEEAADAGCLPRLPAPLQEARRLRGAAAGAHSQRRRRERQPRPDSASRLRGRRPPP